MTVPSVTRVARCALLLAVLTASVTPVTFPGSRDKGFRSSNSVCSSCGDNKESSLDRWKMPVQSRGRKQYYLGIFFKANWYRAMQYCRYHNMFLASIESRQENDELEQLIKENSYGHEHFWISGTDQGEEGRFFWLSNGRPITYTNWNAGEPNNFEYENGELEHCMELWDRDGKGMKWNDSPCSFETYFVCQVDP